VETVDRAAELAVLRDEANFLKDSLDAVNRRIDELEQKPVDES
jgi:ubiquinone biosynthesis protein UbiJ